MTSSVYDRATAPRHDDVGIDHSSCYAEFAVKVLLAWEGYSFAGTHFESGVITGEISRNI